MGLIIGNLTFTQLKQFIVWWVDLGIDYIFGKLTLRMGINIKVLNLNFLLSFLMMLVNFYIFTNF